MSETTSQSTTADFDDDDLGYPELIDRAQTKLREALAVSERDGYRASMPLILNTLGVRDAAVQWLVEGGARVGLDPLPPLREEAGKQLLWSVLNPRITDDNVGGWWENQLRTLIHRADMAQVYLRGEDWS